jgi:hypothetical protein
MVNSSLKHLLRLSALLAVAVVSLIGFPPADAGAHTSWRRASTVGAASHRREAGGGAGRRTTHCAAGVRRVRPPAQDCGKKSTKHLTQRAATHAPSRVSHGQGGSSSATAPPGADALAAPLTPSLPGSAQALTPGGANVGTGASNTGTPESSQSLALAQPPASSQPPAILPTAPQQGVTATATSGVWSQSPSSYSYQWLACGQASEGCAAIANATSVDYTPESSDAGYALAVQVTAVNAFGKGVPSVSALTSPVIESLGALKMPVLSTDNPTAGVMLSTTNGTWAGFPLPSYTYQWQQCDAFGGECSNIANATGPSFVPTAADVGQTIQAVIKASNLLGSVRAVTLASNIVTGAPTELQAPNLSSKTPAEGISLSVSTGAWGGYPTPTYSYRWQDCEASGGLCTAIAGADSPAYTPTVTDVGHVLEAIVSAANSSGMASATSAASSVVTAAQSTVPAPTNSALPTLSSATPAAGVQVTTTTGSWTHTPASYTYQWQRCSAAGGCVNIAGTSAAGYTPASADEGDTLKAVVTATNPGGSASASSALSAVVSGPPTNSSAPSLSSKSPVQGTQLTISAGTWSGYPAPTFTYQWQRCSATGAECAAIANATSASYTPVSADVGHALVGVVSAVNASGSATHDTAASNVVAGTVAVPSNLTAPKLSNSTAQQGAALTASTGSWSNNPTAYAYHWQRCNSAGVECASIGGATSSTYTPVAADVARTLKALVSARNTGGEGSAETNVSDAVVPQSVVLPPAPADTTPPALTGNQPRQGQSDSVSNGTWANDPVSYHYQWQDCNATGGECVNISGATIASYTPATADVGRTVRAIVTARNAGGESSVESSVSAIVLAAVPVSMVAPSLSPASTREGVTETASPGSWTYAPSSFTYQWEDCNVSGEECAAIAGATSPTYTPATNDVGYMLMVTVTANNAGVRGSASSGNSGRLVITPSAQSFYSPNVGTSFSGPESVWNTPVLNGEYDPNSESLVETLASWGTHSMNGINTTAYSSPIYTVPASQPTVPVVLDYQTPPLNTALQAVPIPPNVRPAAGTDGTLVIYQPSSNQMWEFWRLREALVAPVASTFAATVSSGGGLAAGTYYYEVTALSANGETTPSEAFKVIVPQSESRVSLSFKGVIDGQGYKIYRGTEATNIGYLGTLNQATDSYGTEVTYVDTGAVSGSAPPTVDRASTPGVWHAAWAGRIQDVSSDPGYYRMVRSAGGAVTEEPTWGSTASSLPVADGMITMQDLGQGSINHALQLLVPSSRSAVHSYPAQRTDGAATGAGAIPEGAHFVLSQSVNCNEQATPFMRMVCVAAQRYGLIVSDQTHGGLALRGEDPTPLMQAGGQNPYPAYYTDSTGKMWEPYQMMAAFPWSQLHLLPMQLEAQNEFHP